MLTEAAIIRALQREADEYGLVFTAQTYRIDPGQLSQILSGKRPVTKRVANLLGYEAVQMYRGL